MSTLGEYRRFFREFRRDFHHTGAVLPSGSALAAALAAPLDEIAAPARVLEVGPGTGAVTRAIVRRMRPGDRLDAVEINPHFAEQLRLRLESDPAMRPRRDDVRVLNVPVQEVAGEAAYDLIVSGLPLNNFSPGDVRDIFAAFRRLLAPGGSLSYFEYALIRRLKAPFVGRAERARLAEVGRLLTDYVAAHQVKARRVLWNVPPAIARQLRFSPAPLS